MRWQFSMQPAMWGVTTTLSRPRSGLSAAGGSGSVTSRKAKIRPVRQLVGQGLLVDEAAACGIDEHGAVAHPPQPSAPIRCGSPRWPQREPTPRRCAPSARRGRPAPRLAGRPRRRLGTSRGLLAHAPATSASYGAMTGLICAVLLLRAHRELFDPWEAASHGERPMQAPDPLDRPPPMASFPAVDRSGPSVITNSLSSSSRAGTMGGEPPRVNSSERLGAMVVPTVDGLIASSSNILESLLVCHRVRPIASQN